VEGFIRGEPALRVNVINRAKLKVASQTAGVSSRIKINGEKVEVVIRAQSAVASMRVSRRRITERRCARCSISARTIAPGMIKNIKERALSIII